MVRSTIFDDGVAPMVYPGLGVGSIPSHGGELEVGGKWMTDSGTDQKRLSLNSCPSCKSILFSF